MASQHTLDTFKATPQLFVLRYRCSGCGLAVEGCEDAGLDQTVCENCHALLDEDDQIALSASASYPPQFTEEELG